MPKRKNKKKMIEKKVEETSVAETLKKASEGLYYISETDAEIVPFVGNKAESVTKEEILRQTQNTPDTPVAERIFEETFQRLTRMEDWFGEEEKATAAKYAELRDLLKNNLKDLKVFKVGSIEIEIYFVGLDQAGNLMGIQTKAVET